MIIKTKEDFIGKYIKLPKNLSKKKFNKIRDKFVRLGIYIDNGFFNYFRLQSECIYICKHWRTHKFGIFGDYPAYCSQISIKDFLKEEIIGKPSDLNIYVEGFEVDAKEWELDKLNEDSYVFKKRPLTEFVDTYIRLGVNTANFNILAIGFRESFTHYRTIESLDEENYTLKKPFQVKIEIDEQDDYIASIDKLGIHCWGDNPFELIKEIKYEILDLYDSLVLDLGWELGKTPKAWQKILKKHIKYKKVSYEN